MEPDRSAAQIEWEYSADIRRDHPFVINLANGLGLSSGQLDDLFVAAAAIGT